MSLLLFVSIVVGTWILAGALIGLVVMFQDRLRGVAAFLGSLGAAVGAISFFGAFAGIVAMPIGSAVLMWDLRRAGVFGTRLATAHVVGAILFMVPLIARYANEALIDDPATAVPLLAFAFPYGFSWITIGWSLRHGAPVLEHRVEETP